MTRRDRSPYRAAAVVMLLALTALPAAASSTDADPFLDGVLGVTWGDPAPGSGGGPATRLRLTTDAGASFTLDAGALEGRILAGPAQLLGRRVRVWHPADRRPPTGGGLLHAVAITPLEPEPERSVTGSQQWVSLLCRFPDVAPSSTSIGYFLDMFDNTSGRLDHYWRELSYGAIDVQGSTAFDWRPLPSPQGAYIPIPGDGCGTANGADLDALFADCVAAFDDLVDFSNGGEPFVGINLMFNSDLDGCAWGGRHWATLDGVSKMWRVTWEPPWGWGNVAVMAHEMGHGFGLPHSNNWDSDGSPYDNTWDVMSDTWHYYRSDPSYGALGKHTIAYHKDLLGWIPADRRFEAPPDSMTTLDLADLAEPSTAAYHFAVIPIGSGGEHYTVEARGRTGAYDGNLPGDAVIIHHVLPSRDQPAWAYDDAEPPGDFASGEGVMWRVGETFSDPAHEVVVTVDAATADGFRVTILRGDPGLVFRDGFEAGTLAAWSDALP